MTTAALDLATFPVSFSGAQRAGQDEERGGGPHRPLTRRRVHIARLGFYRSEELSVEEGSDDFELTVDLLHDFIPRLGARSLRTIGERVEHSMKRTHDIWGVGFSRAREGVEDTNGLAP